jgi:hypothetical protein
LKTDLFDHHEGRRDISGDSNEGDMAADLAGSDRLSECTGTAHLNHMIDAAPACPGGKTLAPIGMLLVVDDVDAPSWVEAALFRERGIANRFGLAMTDMRNPFLKSTHNKTPPAGILLNFTS